MVPPAPAVKRRLHAVEIFVFGSSKRKDRLLALKKAGVPGFSGPGGASNVEKPSMAHCWLMHEAVEVLSNGRARAIGSIAARGSSMEKCMVSGAGQCWSFQEYWLISGDS